mgnify:FL=1
MAVTGAEEDLARDMAAALTVDQRMSEGAGRRNSPLRLRIRLGFAFGVETAAPVSPGLTAVGASAIKLAARETTGDMSSGVGSRGRWTMGMRGGTAAI